MATRFAWMCDFSRRLERKLSAEIATMQALATQAEKQMINLHADRIILAQSRDNWECAAKANDAVVAQLKADNAALRAEVERLEKDRVNHDLLDERNQLLEDKERLDWLEAAPNRHVIGETGCTGAPFFICQDRDNVKTAACGAATVRGAIDKARAALNRSP